MYFLKIVQLIFGTLSESLDFVVLQWDVLLFGVGDQIFVELLPSKVLAEDLKATEIHCALIMLSKIKVLMSFLNPLIVEENLPVYKFVDYSL